ncbi:UDP-N-acetylmuramate dehydrogenase [Arcobacter sp. HD9-500m-PIT-SAG03]|nr:UDP-N-acetylmuramate dehydrogenase [Arcobacter sp. HD9-500m-PIT-SAG03]
MNNFFKEINFSKYSSIRIGPISDVLVIEEMGQYSEYKILGLGNNVLISDSHPSFAVLGSTFDYIENKNGLLHVGCATKSGKLLSYAKKNDLANFEFLGKLPGSLGGLVKMNAGLKEFEIFNYIHSIKTKDGYIKKEDIQYSYRHTNINTIVYEVVFNCTSGYSKDQSEVFKKMRDNQPQVPSAGSCFKNPQNDSAGRLIEAVGLKGFQKGNMAFSAQHANFLANMGSGDFEDAIYLINLAKRKVKEKFNINLEEEIIIY